MRPHTAILCAGIAISASGAAAQNQYLYADALPDETYVYMDMAYELTSCSLPKDTAYVVLTGMRNSDTYFARSGPASTFNYTSQNIVIGGAAGAFPPMIGWAVATGGISIESVLMFALIFIWTPPHFWALALFRNEDYKAAKIPMLPVDKGTIVTRRHILAYALLLAPIAIAPAFTQIGGPLYFAVALVFNIIFIIGAFRIWKRNDELATADNYRVEKKFFAFSILYLFVHFVALLSEAALRAFDLNIATWPVWF